MKVVEDHCKCAAAFLYVLFKSIYM